MTHGGGGPTVEDPKSLNVVGGRVQWVWKGLHPRSNDGTVLTELDTGEKVLSGPRNPRFGDDPTGFECCWFAVQVVDDEVEDLWREGAGHRGLHQDCLDARSRSR